MAKVQIIVTNVYTEVKNVSKETEAKIYRELAFEIQDFNPAGGFKPPRIHHLYSKKNKLTYTGLLKHLIEILDEDEVEYEIIDKREKPEQNANFHFVPFLDKEGKIPLKKRDYQQEIIDKCVDREVIQAATGAGKSVALHTPLLTPSGLVKMGDIHIGDIVYDENKQGRIQDNRHLGRVLYRPLGIDILHARSAGERLAAVDDFAAASAVLTRSAFSFRSPFK